MKRVWCLYRVSTKSQVNLEDDIPLQRNACINFIHKQHGWTLCNELYEKGISGWKTKNDDRDALLTIREGAINNEFDVLLVFMLDRLGRREDETPLVISFLHDCGVEVWSVQEGKRSIESHIDKLITYIGFWQSSGESLKTSIRVRESKKQLSEQGYYQGGIPPFGYKLSETNERHWKDSSRRIKRLSICIDEADIVRIIFDLYVNQNHGIKRITSYLNNNHFKTRSGKEFHTSLVSRILKNPVYIGYKKYNSFDSEKEGFQPYNEKLCIIPNEMYEKAQKIRKSRNNKNQLQDKSNILTKGNLMFSGLARCYYCNSKLTANYLYRNVLRKDGSTYKKVIYRYTCPLNKGKDTVHEQYVWGAKKYDKIIMDEVKKLIESIEIKKLINTTEKNIKSTVLDSLEKNLRDLIKELRRLKNQRWLLSEEIIKVIENKSHFTSEQIGEAIELKEKEIISSEQKISDLNLRVKLFKETASKINGREILDWECLFEEADNDRKKAMLANLINTVQLGRNRVIITFNFFFQEFLENLQKN
ncbi:recombinase family protein [Bacillus salacetis]|uniref:Recombinase family protein n=1 Tax=Bacillus salacetis TaxID=2315464 RepID=A0A3A1R2W9_9BACI|nr:recombinase family protein [Bacillus salacetis]RIW35641.1 recombinase family protein [Bacillus salacetis]